MGAVRPRHPMKTASQVTPHDRRRIAVAAAVDTRTVERWLRGDPIRSTVAARIAQALDELRLDVKPATPTTPGERYVEIDPEAAIADSEK